MPHATWIPEAHCAVAQSLGVLGDAWDLLLIRDLARGHRRFEQLTGELGISRKILTERLRKLETHGLVQRKPYSALRHEYWLTPRGEALVPVLVALQDWGDQWLLGDGVPTGLGSDSASQRVRALIGSSVPPLELPSTVGGSLEVAAPDAPTILFGYPLASLSPKPAGWERIPGAIGCTLENRIFRDRYPQIMKLGVRLRGVSTQRSEDQAVFSDAEGVPFPLLSDAELKLTAALRLPTFRAHDIPRIRRLILIIAPDRTIVDALFPITGIPAAVDWAIDRVSRAAR